MAKKKVATSVSKDFEDVHVFVEDSAYDFLSLSLQNDTEKIEEFIYNLSCKVQKAAAKKAKQRYRVGVEQYAKIKGSKTVYEAYADVPINNRIFIKIRNHKNHICFNLKEIENKTIERLFNLKSDHIND